MNASNHIIEIACEPHHVSEAVQAILHSIVFFRCHGKFNYKHEGSYSIGTLGFEEVNCSYLELTYVRCSSPSLVNSVDAKVKEFVDRLLPNYYSHVKSNFSASGQNAERVVAPSYTSLNTTPGLAPSASSSSPTSYAAGSNILGQPHSRIIHPGTCCGTIYLEFYSRRPSRWPFNEASITWEVWALKVTINPPKSSQTKASFGTHTSVGVGGSGSNAMAQGNTQIRTEHLVSQKLIEIVQVINSDEYYLPQMPHAKNISCVFDTSHIDSQPYLFKISFRIGDTQASTDVRVTLPLPEILKKGKYHLRSEFESKVWDRIIIEEWGDLNEHLYRLDLITVDTRKRFLFLGKTNEVFRYEPYKCKLIDLSDQKELDVLGKMFRKYNMNDISGRQSVASFNIYGVGPLLLLIQQSKGLKMVEKDDVVEGTFKDEYIVDLPNENPADGSQKLRFLYPSGDSDSALPSLIQWLDPGEPGRLGEKMEAVVIVVSIDELSNEEDEPIKYQGVFDLPEGYGCMRSESFDRHFTFPPRYVPRTSHEVSLEILVTRPSASFETAISQTANVHYQKGSFVVGAEVYTYQILEGPMRDLESPINEQHTKRVKQIYDSRYDIYYNIDMETRECKIERNFRDRKLEVHFAEIAGVGPDTIDISNDTLDTLLYNTDGFHLLRESIDSNEGMILRFEERKYVHEKRLGSTQFGSFKGPMSIVRETTIHALKNSEGQEMLALHNDYLITVFVYNQNQDQVMAKIFLRPLQESLINDVYFHKQLDVSECFGQSKKERQQFTLSYPLQELDADATAVAIDMAEDTIYAQSMKSLFEIDLVRPLQLSQFEVEFDNYYIYITWLLVAEPPLNYRYEQEEATSLVRSRDNVIVQVQNSEINCAEACEFYNCKKFSYCTTDRSCIINPGSVDGADTVRRQHCKFFVEQFGHETTSNRPHRVIAWLTDIIETFADVSNTTDESGGASTAPEMLAITLRHPKTREIQVLLPTSLTSELDLDEYFSESDEVDVSQEDDSAETQPQYTLKYEEREFVAPKDNSKESSSNENMHRWTAEQVSYEDCAMLCTDHDCRTFSYCDNKQMCHTTRIQKQSQIKKASQHNPHCNIYERDYLSKFQVYHLVLRPLTARKELHVSSVSECAQNCIDMDNFNCLSFDYCHYGDYGATWKELDKSENNCFLQRKHMSLGDMQRTTKKARKYAGDRSNSTGIATCDHYSRSLETDFDLYAEKKLIDLSQGYHTKIVASVETCAAECIARSKCAGFTFCYDFSASTVKQECVLANAPLSRSNVQFEPGCSSYLLSKQSEFYTPERRSNSKSPDDKPDEAAQVNNGSYEGDKPTSGNQYDGAMDEETVSEYIVNLLSSRPLGGSSGHAFAFFFGLILAISSMAIYKHREKVMEYTQVISRRVGFYR
ncbi:Autophagy-related protein, partial [Fragariocoptes setiger]